VIRSVPAISEADASRVMADPAEHDGGELVEIKDSSGRRYMARITVARTTEKDFDVQVIARIDSGV
jgi:hypothetical protein